jgi:hypothetical protein
VNRHQRGDAEHLKDASEHLAVLDAHLQRGSLDDVLIRDAVSHRLEVAIDAIGRVTPELLDSEARVIGQRSWRCGTSSRISTPISIPPSCRTRSIIDLASFAN